MAGGLTEREQLLVDTVIQGVSEQVAHSCHFNEFQRHALYEFIEAVEKEGADGETHIIVFRIGNNVRDAVKKIGQWAIWIVLGALAVALYFLLVRPWSMKI